MSGSGQRLTVLVGITSRSWGGNEKWASEAARGLMARGHSVSAFWSHAPVGDELAARGVPSRKISLWGDLNPVGFYALARLVRRVRPDVLLLTKQREYWMGGLMARAAGGPLVVLRLGLRRPLKDDLKRRAAFGRFADLVIVNSTAVRDAVVGPDWLDPSKVKVLLNGVDNEPVDTAAGHAALEALGVAPGTPVVAGAGRLTRQKGFDVLIPAFVMVTSERPDAHLVIVGEGGQRAALSELAAATGRGDTIIFAGHRDDVRTILSAVDVYALSSRNEGMANTLLEAMSVGAPIVATDVSGTLEAVRDGSEALVVPPENPRALADAILRLLRDRALAERLGSSAAAVAKERFGRERMITELESMLLAELSAKRPARDVGPVGGKRAGRDTREGDA